MWGADNNMPARDVFQIPRPVRAPRAWVEVWVDVIETGG